MMSYLSLNYNIKHDETPISQRATTKERTDSTINTKVKPKKAKHTNTSHRQSISTKTSSSSQRHIDITHYIHPTRTPTIPTQKLSTLPIPVSKATSKINPLLVLVLVGYKYKLNYISKRPFHKISWLVLEHRLRLFLVLREKSHRMMLLMRILRRHELGGGREGNYFPTGRRGVSEML